MYDGITADEVAQQLQARNVNRSPRRKFKKVIAKEMDQQLQRVSGFQIFSRDQRVFTSERDSACDYWELYEDWSQQQEHGASCGENF